jgi:hypothetical protein
MQFIRNVAGWASGKQKLRTSKEVITSLPFQQASTTTMEDVLPTLDGAFFPPGSHTGEALAAQIELLDRRWRDWGLPLPIQQLLVNFAGFLGANRENHGQRSMTPQAKDTTDMKSI